MIAAIATYETSGPTLDSQIVTASSADVVFDNTTPKSASQAIRKVYDLGWRPLHFLTSVSTSVATVLEPAGLEKAQGLQQAAHLSFDLPLLLPGFHVHTTPADFFPLKQMHLQRFEARQWEGIRVWAKVTDTRCSA